MLQDDEDASPRRQFHTLRQAAEKLGLDYRRAQRLAANGYFGPIGRGGRTGRGPWLVPDATVQRLRNGEGASA